MNTYRILYWFDSVVTERFVRANRECDAIKEVRKTIGDKTIISVSLCPTR